MCVRYYSRCLSAFLKSRSVVQPGCRAMEVVGSSRGKKQAKTLAQQQGGLQSTQGQNGASVVRAVDCTGWVIGCLRFFFWLAVCLKFFGSSRCRWYQRGVQELCFFTLEALLAIEKSGSVSQKSGFRPKKLKWRAPCKFVQ